MNAFQGIKVKSRWTVNTLGPSSCWLPSTIWLELTHFRLTLYIKGQMAEKWGERVQERKVGGLGCAGALAFESAQQVPTCFRGYIK